MAAPNPAQGARILIADDDPLIVAVLSEAFRRNGFTVLTAETGAEAAAVHERTRIVLTVLDAHMSGYSLYESVEAIRVGARDSRTPILVLSGAATRPPELRDPNIGYLAKPVELDTLRREARRLIDAHPIDGTP
jgi:two-component system OmpR family response regulator